MRHQNHHHFRVFLAKAGVKEMAGMVFLEEIRKTFTPIKNRRDDESFPLAAAFLLTRRYVKAQKPDDLATVIFSSGSTGAPKGVMLSHRNIAANVEGIGQVIQFTASDRIMGVLPLFHSFGFTGTLWLPLLAGFGVVYHPNPTDAKTIGETVQKYQATLLISTPTFYAGYLRRCTREQFAIAAILNRRRGKAARANRQRVSRKIRHRPSWKATAAPSSRRWSP